MIKHLGLALMLASTVANAAPLFPTHIKNPKTCGELGDACGWGQTCCAPYHCHAEIATGECWD